MTALADSAANQGGPPSRVFGEGSLGMRLRGGNTVGRFEGRA